MSSIEAQVSAVIGPLEVGTLGSAILLGCAALQGYFYYSNFDSDSRRRKTLVAAVMYFIHRRKTFFSDIAKLILSFVDVFYFCCCAALLWSLTITFFGNTDRVKVLPMAQLGGMTIATAVMNILMQGFYAYRLWRLSSSPLLPAAVVLSTIVSTVVTIWGAISGFVYTGEWLGSHQWVGITIASCEIVGSLLITGGTAWYLVKAKIWAHQKTARQIDRMIVWTLETGFPPSICRIVVLICLVRYHTVGEIWLGPFSVIAGVQANCVLAAINTSIVWRRNSNVHMFHSNSGSELPTVEIRVDEIVRHDAENGPFGNIKFSHSPSNVLDARDNEHFGCDMLDIVNHLTFGQWLLNKHMRIQPDLKIVCGNYGIEDRTRIVSCVPGTGVYIRDMGGLVGNPFRRVCPTTP
ncbi:hypothetical protein CONPUDRAFT_75695 [Coniophora puteana RWD-64-598 SS2]|uniref:DUF6534 domain-containing protein n=1 Tax=Coniophora puteana (strain RWD-64-598) TaxID=741705 RepID=A0A5M3MG87_CONPW|nr:uncharacterized protein CONPUDRAFT_75695 [Coniophora puteana RWD-64-598 SS2]EIW77940.1 hypothetical protein CONPUDRAFT_75695 [Coniophora puteana RWD-64-598 SS2]